MSAAERSAVTFRIFGDTLVPSEITALLGCEPSRSCSKGDLRLVRGGAHRYIEKSGSWRLSAADRAPEEVAAQVRELLDRLPQDVAVWSRLRERFEMDMFCGVFMGSSNDMLEFPPALLEALAMRGIGLKLDLYDFLRE